VRTGGRGALEQRRGVAVCFAPPPRGVERAPRFLIINTLHTHICKGTPLAPH